MKSKQDIITPAQQLVLADGSPLRSAEKEREINLRGMITMKIIDELGEIGDIIADDMENEDKDPLSTEVIMEIEHRAYNIQKAILNFEQEMK